MIIELWVCPTPGCGNYYASSSAGELDKLWNNDAKGNKTFQRSRCPDCFRSRQISVDRVRVTFDYEPSDNETETP